MNLAYIEMRTILARVIWNFEMRLADESKSWTQGQQAWVVWEKAELMMYLTPRGRSV
ncbi:Trichothecene C-15 hydroxylase [Colletotrichum fructicola]|nr:Trichothecene C-15 hydroxylase [Colletotrichum fructicola]KAF4922898.1 Trichothecene C-15 hydroxylase [Colletotrichum fructicola]